MENEIIPQTNNLAEYDVGLDYDIISLNDNNPYLSSPNATTDLYFYQTKDTLLDPEVYRAFIKNIESRFRRSKEYKTYKAYLMSMGFDHCQIMGNVESGEKVDIELHHNILNLFDICILICEHVLNTVGFVSSFDIIQLLIKEHFENRIPCTFLSVTMHQTYTNSGLEGYIPPDMTWGRWWELLIKYRYGITYDIATKINTYIERYNNQLPVSINVPTQEQILNFAAYNAYGMDPSMINNTYSPFQQNVGGDPFV